MNVKLSGIRLSLVPYVTLFCVTSFDVMIAAMTAKDYPKRRRSQLEMTYKPVTTEKVKRQPEDRIVSDAKDNSDEAQD